ncbi:MAG: PEP-CTERM sorting domain-containing protein [Pirellulales bacterium]
MRILLLVIALAAAVVATNARADFTNFLDGSTLPGDAGWIVDGDPGTLVDLGGGNSGIRQVDDDPGAGGGQHGGSYDEFYLTVADPSNTLATRFRLEQYTPGANLTTLLALTAGGNVDTPAIGLGIRNVEGLDRWQLVRFIFESNNPGDPAAILTDIAPVIFNQFNEALIHIDSDTDLVRFSWNGMELYNTVTPTDFGGADGFPEFGASNFWGEGGTSTVTYDWVGYGPEYIPPPGPTTHTWNVDLNGNWSLASNWTGGEPNAVGVSANFLGAITAARTITVDGPKTVGSLTFNNTNSYTLAGPGPLQINSAAASAIEVTVGSHTISAPLSIAAGKTVSRTGPGTLTISGNQSHGAGAILVANEGVTNLNSDGGANLTVQANARVNFGSTQHLAALQFGGGATVQLTAGGTKNLVTPSLTFSGPPDGRSGQLDLTDNAMIVDYVAGSSPTMDIRQRIIAGRGKTGLGATWNGQGITSSTAAADAATNPEGTSVGYAANIELPLGQYTNFRGQAVDDTVVLVRYTRTGDANLDGVVNDDDVTIVSATYGPGVSQPAWGLGDFDYNGFVDDDDVTLLGVFYDPAAPPLAVSATGSSDGVTAVPEPGTLMLAALAILVAAATSRRNRSRRLKAAATAMRRFLATSRSAR